jgi:hypothetical protein
MELLEKIYQATPDGAFKRIHARTGISRVTQYKTLANKQKLNYEVLIEIIQEIQDEAEKQKNEAEKHLKLVAEAKQHFFKIQKTAA